MSKLPQRPRQHVLEAESRRFVEAQFPQEWIFRDGQPDYGIDLFVEIVRDGEVSGASFLIQVKATDKPRMSKKGRYISHRCETRTLKYFLERPEPVIYVVYNSQDRKAYWIWIQDYVRANLQRGWQGQKKATIKISRDNELNAAAAEEITQRVLFLHDRAKWLTATQTARNPFFEYRFGATDEYIQVTAHSRYPGAVEDCPVVMKGMFKFDQSQEAQTKMQELVQAIKTGTDVELDSRYFEGFSLPEAFSDILAQIGVNELKLATLSISSAPSGQQLIASLQALNETRDVIYELPNLTFRQLRAGTEETTWSNREQEIVPEIILRFNHKEPKSTFTIRVGRERITAVEMRRLLEIQKALSAATYLRVVNPETAGSFEMVAEPGWISAPDQNLVQVAGELALIQEKTQKKIVFPDYIPVEARALISSVASAVSTGRSLERVSRLRVAVHRRMADTLRKLYLEQGRFRLKLEAGRRDVDLNGTQLSLGPVVVIIPDVGLLDEDLQRMGEATESVPAGDTQKDLLELELDIGDPGLWFYHLDWLPIEVRTQLEQQ